MRPRTWLRGHREATTVSTRSQATQVGKGYSQGMSHVCRNNMATVWDNVTQSAGTSRLMTLLSGPPVEISASVFLNLKCYMASHLLSDKEAHVCSALALCHSRASFYCFLTTALWALLLQYSCLENPHGQWSWAGYSPWVAESDKWLSDWGQNSTQRWKLAAQGGVLCHTEVVVWRFKDRPSECRLGTPLLSLPLCLPHASLLSLFAVPPPPPPQPWVSLAPDQIALISVPKALSQPVPLLPLVPAHLTPARVRAPGPWLSWQENKDSWQWENPVKENMSAVVVMALLSENSLCQRTALASHTCYMDRCFQLLSLTSLRARFFSDWLLRDSEGTKGNRG